MKWFYMLHGQEAIAYVKNPILFHMWREYKRSELVPDNPNRIEQ